jgi:Ala-tRNA(Pro) deacylase
MAESLELVSGFLEENGVEYAVVEHDERFTAAAEARASGVEPIDAAKDVLLRIDDAYVLAVIPASERLDLAKARQVLGKDDRPRLATEQEIAADFPSFEVGALPPFAPLLGIPEIVDRRLLDHDRVLCSAGDHRHSLKVDPSDLVTLTKAGVADLCQD